MTWRGSLLPLHSDFSWLLDSVGSMTPVGIDEEEADARIAAIGVLESTRNAADGFIGLNENAAVDARIDYELGGIIHCIRPDHPAGIPFWINSVSHPNANDLTEGTRNDTIQMGFNVQGADYDPDKPTIGEYFESHWCENVGRGPEIVTERHTVYISPVANSAFDKGEEVRLASYTIRTGMAPDGSTLESGGNPVNPIIDYYHTSGNFYIKSPLTGHQYFGSEPNQIYVGTGQDNTSFFRIVLDVQNNAAVFDLTGIITKITCSKPMQLAVVTGATFFASSQSSTAIDTEGGITAKLQVQGTSINAVWPPLIGQSDPAATSGVMKFYGTVIDDRFVPAVIAGNTAARQLLMFRETSSTTDPTTSEAPTSGDYIVHNNTSNGKWFFARNCGGSIKKVELT